MSLAAIGYHFGTTEALLNEAVFQGIGEWGEQLGKVLAEAARHDGPALDRFEAVWSGAIDSFHDYRGVLAASYELMVRAEQESEVRQRLAAAITEARHGLAELFAGVDPAAEPQRAHQVGSFHYALLSGLLTQWLVDPEQTPSGGDLAAVLGELIRTTAP